MFWTVVFGLVATAIAQDATVTPETFGATVVEASLDRIQSACIFEYDNQFFRRMAYVETNDGQVIDTYPDNYDGGIWKIDEIMYDQTVNPVSSDTRNLISAIQQESSLGNIDWYQTTWQDLREPLYSALAAMLYTFDRVGDSSYRIPPAVEDQALFWELYIRTGGDTDYFILAAETLQAGCETAGGADIVFVLDGSGSIGAINFQQCLDFVQRVVNEFEIGPTKYRIGVQQYSSSSTIEWFLNAHDNKEDLLDAIANIDYMTGGTSTWLALDDVVDISFQEVNGARPGFDYPRIAIVMTDGESGSESLTIQAAERLHEAQITTFAISVGSSIRESELEAIATDPDCQHYFPILDFDELGAIIDAIENSACNAPIIINPGNETTDQEFLPGEGQNCQITLPLEGATVKLKPQQTTINYYTASDTYPSEAYYEEKIVALPDETGVLFLPGGILEFIYCLILNNGSISDNVTIGVTPGDDDNCANVTCENGGTCNDLLDEGYECNCVPGFTGEYCETFIPTNPPPTTSTTAGPTTTQDPDWCWWCHDDYCDCAVPDMNPCPPCATPGNCYPGNLYPHYNQASRFCECDEIGRCFEFECQPPLVYLECINGCAWDFTECP